MTAYEMRISDWSSDVCSSDLLELPDRRGAEGVARDEHHAIILFLEQMRQFGDSGGLARPVDPDYQDDLRARKGVDVERFGDRAQDGRSGERRVGKECVSTWRCGGSLDR